MCMSVCMSACGAAAFALHRLTATLSEVNVGLSQLFENNFGKNTYLLECENYCSLIIGLQTSQRSIRSTVPIEAQYMCLVRKHCISANTTASQSKINFLGFRWDIYYILFLLICHGFDKPIVCYFESKTCKTMA